MVTIKTSIALNIKHSLFYKKIYVLLKATQTQNLIKYRMQFITLYNFNIVVFSKNDNF